MPKMIPSTTGYGGSEPKHHFFVTSIAEWRVGYDLGELIRRFKREGYPFNVWMVPGDVNAAYEIESYAPQVEGASCLVSYLHESSEA